MPVSWLSRCLCRISTHLGGGDGVLGGLEIDIRHGDGARYASSGRREWGRCLRDCAVRVRRVLRWFCCDGSAMARGKKRFFPSEIFFSKESSVRKTAQWQIVT